MTRWWLDELVTAGPEHLDPGYVDGYDAKSQVDPSDDVELLVSLGLGPATTIVDLGAGTGVFAIHQLPDFWKVVAIRTIARLLRPGGILRLRDLVFDLDPEQIEPSIEAWMARAVDDPARGYTAEEFAEHVRTEYSTFTWLLEAMLERQGFALLDREVRASVDAAYTCRLDPGAEGTAVPIRRTR